MKNGSCEIIEYNPDIMWFDYQALYENRRNFVIKNFLGKSTYKFEDNIKHPDFNNNSLAKESIMNGNLDNNTINNALIGEYVALTEIIENLKKSINKYKNDINYQTNKNNINNYYVLQYNYRCLLAIIVQFAGLREKTYRKEYCNLAKYITKEFYMQNEDDIYKVQFHNIVQPLLDGIY